MVSWVWEMSSKNICITDDSICEKAKRVQENLNSILIPENRTTLSFSKGRKKFKWYKSHGESGDECECLIQEELPILRTLLSVYDDRDIFNADEFGLCYRMESDTTIGPKRLLGKKKRKDRITVLASANADGSERVTPLVVGPSRSPRSFSGKTAAELGFYYRHNKKSWMTRLVFFEWLQVFDVYISQTPGRRVILLLDNCTAHGQPEILVTLQNVHVIFLPKNTTSRLQPMDAGIIASVKRRYRQY